MAEVQNDGSTNTPEQLKESRRPEINDRINEIRSGLEQRAPNIPLEHLHQQARDKVAAEIVRGRIKSEKDKALELAYKDQLTGLYNRRWFEDEVERRIAHARRIQQTKGEIRPFWVVYMDWDRFKQVNDKYSHRWGDEALKLAAKLPARDDEPIARLGGEEFAQVLNEDITIAQIPMVMSRYLDALRTESAELFRRANQNTSLPYKERVRRLTFSFGAAKWEGEDKDDLIEKADLATKHAKEHGRNTGYMAHRTRSRNITYLRIPKVKK